MFATPSAIHIRPLPALRRSRLFRLALVVLTSIPTLALAGDARQVAKHVSPLVASVEWDQSEEKKQASVPAEQDPNLAERYLTAVAADRLTQSQPTATRVRFTSGLLISAEGWIATFLGTSGDPAREKEIKVRFGGRTPEPARLVVFDSRTGLAIVKVSRLPQFDISLGSLVGELELETISELEVGEEVFVVNSTQQNDQSISGGIVSGPNRFVSGVSRVALIPSDVRAGELSAGGALVSPHGRLRGIIASTTGADQPVTPGMTFAIPVRFVTQCLELAKSVADGKLEILSAPYLGVQLDNQAIPGTPPVVTNVIENSPAAAAGIRPQDRITMVGRKAVLSPAEVISEIGSRVPDDRIQLIIQRDAQLIALDVELKPLPTPVAESRNSKVLPPRYRLERMPTLYIYDANGKMVPLQTGILEEDAELRAATLQEQIKQSRAKLRTTVGSMADQTGEVRIERSDLDKRFEKLSDEVMALRDQIRELTEQLKKDARQN
ncbi:MAG: PDZ domain-containing protein [Planctomycetota bacterium]|nr:PDZ domain-containing protein [Planctomycetota bacterium]